MDELVRSLSSVKYSGDISLVVTVFVSLLICFFGYRTLRIWMAMAGFGVGAVVTYLICDGIQVTLPTIAWIVIVLLGGLLFGALTFGLFKVGVFLVVALLVYQMANQSTMLLLPNMAEVWKMVAASVIALLVGVLAVKFVKPVVIITTGFGGASMAVNSVFSYIHVTDQNKIYIAVAVVAILGIVVQFATAKEKKYK